MEATEDVDVAETTQSQLFTFHHLLVCLFMVLLLSVILLYQESNNFRYRVKMFCLYFGSGLCGLGVTFWAIPRPRNPVNNFFITYMVHYILNKLLGVEITVRNKEILNKPGAAILVYNHQSSVDMLPLFYAWPNNTVVLAKKELLYAGPFGIGAWLCGTIFVDRLSHDKAKKTMVDTVDRIKAEKLKVAIFAEGTRNHEGSMLPFKKGAFHLAVQGQVPIIPVVFASFDNFYSKKEKRFDEGPILVQVLPPIETTGLTADDVTDLSERTRNKMLVVFDRISVEVKAMK